MDHDSVPPAPCVDTEGDSPAFLNGGGEMGALMRSHDWTTSSLGPPGGWPQPLRTMVRLILNTGHPMYIWWGHDLACLYNDAYRDSIGPERHPGSLGLPARQVWGEIWPIIGAQIDQVMSGRGATWHVDHLVPITRHGRREDVYWTYSYSPIDDETVPTGVGGVLVVCTETTQQVLAARRVARQRDRLARLFEQAPTFMAVLRGPEHRFEIANPRYLRLIGDRPVVGKTVAEALPEAVEQGYVALLDRVFTSGQAYNATGARFSVRLGPDEPAVERFVDFVYQPITDSDGQVTGIFVQGVEVTDRTRADAALRQSQVSFRSALRAGRMGSWETDFAKMTRTWSPEGMDLFGLTLKDDQGRVGGPADEYLAALHPDDRHLGEQFRAMADQQDSFPAEYRIVRPDGATLWLSGHGLVVERGPDGRARRLVSIMADATERKQAEELLRTERERLSLALTTGQMGSYDLNLRDDVLWWSAQTYALFGLSPDHFKPTRDSVEALVDPDDRDAFLALRAQAIAQRRAFTYEFRVRRPDGIRVWLAVRGQAAYDAQGQPVRSFGVIMDITERKLAEEVLREADKAKDLFIATLAHELRNPLAPIRNAIEVLQRTPAVDPRAAWCHEVLDRQTRQMARLLDDLLDVSRMTRNQLQLRREPLRLATIIEQAIEIAQPLIDAREHSFVVTMPDPGARLDGDLVRLAQVFSNILINAAKYTQPQGRITLTAQRQLDQAVVSVTDTGVGLTAEHMPRIFQFFGQVDSESSGSHGGQGIGLSLARGLVELHGGVISAHSDGLGRGSRFEVRLPLAATSAQDEPATGNAEPREPGGRKHRVLIADDLPDIADSLAMLLEAEGHEVSVAYDGEQALHLAEQLRPDVVLLDLGMLKLRGDEVCRRIRASSWGRQMVLIAHTGWGQPHDRKLTAEAGFDHHVVKPIDADTLLGLFAQILRSREVD